jgi:nucleotide-binding universal stress UspA family protein
LDGSELATRSLRHAETLAQKFDATLVLLRATLSPTELILAEASAGAVPVSPAFVDPTKMAADDHRDATAYLEPLAERLRTNGLSVEIAEPEGDAASAILAQARDGRADLIAMTTHGLGGLGRAIFGSVADEVLRHAPCPLLLVRVAESPGHDS